MNEVDFDKEKHKKTAYNNIKIRVFAKLKDNFCHSWRVVTAVMVGFMMSALLFPLFINKIDNQIAKFAVLGSFAAIGVLLVVALLLIKRKKAE